MRLASAAPLLAAPLVLALLAGCDGDTGDLVRDINAAREGCTEAGLRAGDEECVRMMESYAEMGTEAIRTYIGAVRTLDRALDRMPPAQFDTTGLGHAISPGLAPDPSPASPMRPRNGARGYGPGAYGAEAYGRDPYPAPRAAPDRYGSDPYARDPYDGPDRYGAGGYGPDPSDPRGYPGDDRYDDPRRFRGPDSYGGWGDPRDPRGSPGYPGAVDPYRAREGRPGYVDPRDLDPGPAVRGQLLRPEERLRRPWIDGYGDDDRYDRYGRPLRGGWPEDTDRWNDDRYREDLHDLPPQRRRLP